MFCFLAAYSNGYSVSDDDDSDDDDDDDDDLDYYLNGKYNVGGFRLKGEAYVKIIHPYWKYIGHVQYMAEGWKNTDTDIHANYKSFKTKRTMNKLALYDYMINYMIQSSRFMINYGSH